MTEKAILAFQIVKDQVAHHTSRVIMNAHDPLILYMDASTRAIGGVLKFCKFKVVERSLACLSRTGYQTKRPGGGDGAGTLHFRVLRQES